MILLQWYARPQKQRPYHSRTLFSLSDELGIYFIPYDNTLQFKKKLWRLLLTVNNWLWKKPPPEKVSGKLTTITFGQIQLKFDSISFIPIAIYEKGGKTEIVT
jgi:hypothetical protein